VVVHTHYMQVDWLCGVGSDSMASETLDVLDAAVRTITLGVGSDEVQRNWLSDDVTWSLGPYSFPIQL
jgi:hypothetical protein